MYVVRWDSPHFIDGLCWNFYSLLFLFSFLVLWRKGQHRIEWKRFKTENCRIDNHFSLLLVELNEMGMTHKYILSTTFSDIEHLQKFQHPHTHIRNICICQRSETHIDATGYYFSFSVDIFLFFTLFAEFVPLNFLSHSHILYICFLEMRYLYMALSLQSKSTNEMKDKMRHYDKPTTTITGWNLRTNTPKKIVIYESVYWFY